MRYSLAIDIGASGGRHIIGRLDGRKIALTELHRFENGMTERRGRLCWDIDTLINEVNTGIAKCGHTPHSIGIDTWGADFVLLDTDGNVIGDAVAYRDKRTEGMDTEVETIVSYSEHYTRTGIQKQPFNTVYQLMAIKRQNPELLEQADCLLLMPDYLHYRLTGEKRTEYTVASTTALVSASTRDWDWDMIDRLGFPRRLFLPVKQGLTPSHDTASAFLAAPAISDTSVTISSGTWSLLGMETTAPVLTEAAREAGFTNEGGYGGTYRFLKNIMGLWMIQSVRRETKGKPSYADLEQAARASHYDGMVDVNAAAFFSPVSMTEAVANACREAGLPPPECIGDTMRCVYHSLAAEYARSVKRLETLTGKRFTGINIIGGGSKDTYLNELTAKATGLPTYAGPVEGTALGNIVSQMIRSGELSDIGTARQVITNSFAIKEFLP